MHQPRQIIYLLQGQVIQFYTDLLAFDTVRIIASAITAMVSGVCRLQ
jgi:hypothetical protein